MSRQRAGITLIEVLVVVGVLAMLVCLVIPALQSARETARRTQCNEHMKQLALALHSYHDQSECFPPGWHGGNGFAWGTQVLPIFGAYGIGWVYSAYNTINFNKVATSTEQIPPGCNFDQINLVIPFFKCPSANDSQSISSSRCNGTGNDFKFRLATAAVSNYLGNAGTCLTDGGGPFVPIGLGTKPVNEGGAAGSANPGAIEVQVSSQTAGPGVLDNGGVMFEDSRVKLSDISDGTTNTALFAEHYGATCRTDGGVGNTNCSSSGRDACFAYWANADSYAGGNGATVASDVCFSSIIGVNGSGNGGVGGNGDISAPHEDGAQIALCDGSVRYISNLVDQGVLNKLCYRNDSQHTTLPLQ